MTVPSMRIFEDISTNCGTVTGKQHRQMRVAAKKQASDITENGFEAYVESGGRKAHGCKS
jgi:hypothetical protein